MAIYSYKGRNSEGALVKGTLEASNPDEVAAELSQKNIVPLDIREQKKQVSLFGKLNKDLSTKGVTSEDLIIFCRQVYALIKAGVPIVNALTYLIETTRSKMLADCLHGIIGNISKGQTLTQSMQKYPKVFSPIFISMVDAGENGGQLDVAFKQLIDHLELEDRTVKQVKSVVRYPILVITAIIGALAVVNFMVVPAFAKMFANFKSTLPLPTRILIGMSNFFTNYWPYVLVGIVIIGIAIYRFLKTKKGRFWWDKQKIRLPIMGPIIKRIILARFSRTLAMMVHTGLPIVQGLSLVANVVGNEFVKERILFIREGVERGESLTKKAQEANLFPGMVLQMISVGEETGSIDNLLQEVAKYYESEIEYDLKHLAEMIEPILLVFMGAMVLVLALGIFLPMWDMVKFAR